MRYAGHVVRKGDRRGIYRVFVGKPEGKRLVGKRPLGRPKHRWEVNIKMAIQDGFALSVLSGSEIRE